MPMDATVDGHPLTNQPMTYRMKSLPPVVDYAADGTPIVTKRPSEVGNEIEWEWGNVVPPETFDEVRAVRGSTLVHTIAFNLKDSHVPSVYQVIWLNDPDLESAGGLMYRPIVAKFLVIAAVNS